METNLHIYPSPITHESRIEKITDFISKKNYFNRIIIIGIYQHNLPLKEKLSNNVEVVRIKAPFANKDGFIAKIFKTIIWSFKVFFFARKVKVDCVNCHSLPVLPLCYFISRATKAKLVYDTHELETETYGSRGLRKKISKLVEKRLIKKVDVVSVVGQKIAEWYAETYQIPMPFVVRNIPALGKINEIDFQESIFRKEFHIPDDHIIFLYQGFLGEGRGIERIVEVFKKVSPKNHIVFLGYGEMREGIINLCEHYNNFHFHDAVSPAVLWKYTRSADIGLCLIENKCLSYYFSLPNKLFEFLSNGLPTFINDCPEQKIIIEELNCGWVAPEKDSTFINIINNLTKDEILLFHYNALKINDLMSWEKETIELEKIYQQIVK